MTLNEYQQKSNGTARFPDQENSFIYATLGMMGEAGEVAKKIKKVWRDKGKKIEPADRDEIKKEMGDVLWYLAQLGLILDLELEDIAQTNLAKTASRLERHVINGTGDNR
ncbi:MAG: nucleoside triphosphate pyrophosphohydrolase family protein [Patescibacteria group bacterium]|jgi:NTP pyrophosphatase (non-canonical NTP hydrolase)